MPKSGGGDDSVSRIREMQRRVLAYWMKHPEAKDTVEGIQQWWLAGAPPGGTAGELAVALDGLVEKGWISSSAHAGPRVYGLVGPKSFEIQQFLER